MTTKDKKTVASEMRRIGYRYIILPSSDLDALYTKSASEIGPLLRFSLPTDTPQVMTIDHYLGASDQ